MFCLINLLILLTFLSNSLALENSLPPVLNSNCPLVDDINHAVMLPFSQDCNKYYSCLKGMAYLQQCPNNLHWSPLTYRCDYPDKAKCETAALPVPANINNQHFSNTLPASLTSEILYQLHPSDCSKYFKCQALACPINYYWNSRTQKCDFPHSAQCPFLKGVDDLTNLNLSPVLPANSFQIQPNHAKRFTLPYPNDCAKFYQCQTILCPGNYHWNSRLQQCDLPQMAQCPLKPEIVSTLETSTTVIPTAFTAPPTGPMLANGKGPVECLACAQTCDGYLHHYMPHPNDCHKFIQCNGWSFIHTCPDNLFWNAKLNTCDRMCVEN